MKIQSQGIFTYLIKFRGPILLILCLSMFLFIGLNNIETPGLYYDEALFVNAATGGDVAKRIANIPVMIMPYIGALKGWIYYPIFKIFGIDYLSIRLPTLLFGAFAIGLTWKYVHHQFGSVAAYIFLILAAVEPSTIFHSRLDWGPTALMMVFRGGLLLSLAYWFYSGKNKYLFLALFCAGLGTFDKLNFIWLTTSAFAAGLLVYPERFVKLLPYKNKFIVIFALAFIVTILATILLKMLNIKMLEEVGIFDLGKRLSVFLHLLGLTMRGEGFYSFIIKYGVGNNVFVLHSYVLIATFLLALCGIYIGIRDGSLETRPMAHLALLTSFLAIQIFFTKKATGPHHFAMFAPLWLIFMAVGMGSVMQRIQKRSVVLARAIIGLFIILIVSTSIKINLFYHEEFKTNIGNLNWDPASSTELTKTLIAHDMKLMVAVDWGLATNVQALSNNQIKVVDYWAPFKVGLNEAQATLINSNFIEKRAVFVLYVEGKENFPATRRHFLEEAYNRGWKIQKILTLNSKNGNPYIEIYGSEKNR
jgi:hypothetical protein